MEQLHGQLDGQPPDMLLFFNASSPSAPVHGRDVAQQLRKACAARWPEGDPVVLGTSWGCGAPGTGAIGGAPASGGCACLDSWNVLEADKCLVCKEPILAGFYPVDDGKVCDGEGCIDKYTQR